MTAEDVKAGLRVLVRRHGEPYVEGVLRGDVARGVAFVLYARPKSGEGALTWSVDLDTIEVIGGAP